MSLSYRLIFELHDPSGRTIIPRISGVKHATYTKVLGDVGELSIGLSPRALPYTLRELEGYRISALLGISDRGRVETVRDGAFLIQAPSGGVNSDGSTQYGLRALDYNVILRSRRIIYRPDTSQTTKSGAADDMMKEILSENAGAAAVTDYDGGSVPSRQLSGLVIESDAGAGPTIYRTGLERQKLLDVFKDIQAETAALGNEVFFSCYPAGGVRFAQFRTAVGLWGSDRSGAAVFSTDRGNLLTPSLTYNFEDAVSHSYASGSVGPNDNQIVVVSNPRVLPSGFSRVEEFTSAGSVDTDGGNATSEITAAANATLGRSRPTLKFSGDILSTNGTPYALTRRGGWNLGDRVTCQPLPGEPTIKPIIRAVQVDMDASGKVSVSARVESMELLV